MDRHISRVSHYMPFIPSCSFVHLSWQDLPVRVFSRCATANRFYFWHRPKLSNGQKDKQRDTFKGSVALNSPDEGECMCCVMNTNCASQIWDLGKHSVSQKLKRPCFFICKCLQRWLWWWKGRLCLCISPVTSPDGPAHRLCAQGHILLPYRPVRLTMMELCCRRRISVGDNVSKAAVITAHPWRRQRMIEIDFSDCSSST